MDIPSTFGGWLKRRRRELDLTQAELAQRAGCSVPGLRKIESGERRPSKQLAELLARSLEIPIEDRPNFIRAVRGELNVERLRDPTRLSIRGFKPVTKASAPLASLPEIPTSFIGRDQELAALN